MFCFDINNADNVRGIGAVGPMTSGNAPGSAGRIVHNGDRIVSTIGANQRATAPIRKPKPNTVVSTGVTVATPRRHTSAFLSHALRESRIVESIIARSGDFTRPAVNASGIGPLPVPLPAEDHLRAIPDYSGRKTVNIGALITHAEISIQHMQKCRAALIPTAINGGIDVRVNWKRETLEMLN